MKQINWGIIGCGDVCEVKSGPAFNKIQGSKLIAVMRRNAIKAKDFAERHGVPKFYSDANELLNDQEINAVYIATPPSSHELYTELSLKAGKYVYVEKPVSINAAAVERMIAMEQQYGGKVTVAHYRRGLPLFNKVKQLVESGVIGKTKLILLQTLQPLSGKVVIQTEDQWRFNPAISGGGLFHDLAPHQLDILYWLFGAPLHSHAMAANQGRLYNAPDVTMVQLTFADDIYFNGTWNFNVAENATEDACEIIGDKGKIRFSFFRSGSIEVSINDRKEIIEQATPPHIQQPHIENVIKFFRGETLNPCTLQDALVTMKIMDKAML